MKPIMVTRINNKDLAGVIMTSLKLLLPTFFLLLGTVECNQIGYGNKPYFSSTSTTYKKQIGSTVIFNCKVENLGTSTLIWKKDGRMISAGSVVIRKDNRMRLHGHSLEISDITEEDSGQYICEVETFGSPLNQKHTLEVLVPPRVQPKPSDGKFVVRKDSTITMECEGHGNPIPNITWIRQNNMLPSGEKSYRGASLVINKVSRHDVGVYECTADNGVGSPTTAQIDLQVLYPPEIEIDQTWIRSKDMIESEISCVVHGDPQPEVKWFKETMLLEPTNNRFTEVYGNKRVLLIRNFSVQEFGNYSCQATNSLGKASKSVEVSGRPHTARVTSQPVSSSKTEYNLTWSVDSFLDILEYRILYREVLKSMNGLGTRQSEWTNIIPTIETRDQRSSSQQLTFSGQFVFNSLQPDTEYEIIIQSRNQEGWSDPSEIFKFATRSKDYDPRGLELYKYNQQGYQISGSEHTAVSTFVIVLTILQAIFQ